MRAAAQRSARRGSRTRVRSRFGEVLALKHNREDGDVSVIALYETYTSVVTVVACFSRAALAYEAEADTALPRALPSA